MFVFVQVTLLHGRGASCWPERTQRERRLLFLVCVVSVGLFISLITTGVFYKQSEFEVLFKLLILLKRNTCRPRIKAQCFPSVSEVC